MFEGQGSTIIHIKVHVKFTAKGLYEKILLSFIYLFHLQAYILYFHTL